MDTSRTLGTLAHRSIQRALLHGAQTYDDVTVVVGQVVDDSGFTVRRHATVSTVRGRVLSYLWDHSLDRTHEVIDTEAPYGDVFVDVVWRDERGRILFDEVKSGLACQAETLAIREQTDIYAAAGRATYGAQFAGVRWVNLRYPAQSRFKRMPGPSTAVPQAVRGGTR